MSMSRIQVHFSCFFFTFFCVGGGGCQTGKPCPCLGGPNCSSRLLTAAMGDGGMRGKVGVS